MPFDVLFLCTHNSARSILAEAMLNHWARRLGADIVAHSGGSAPSGRVQPLAIEVMRNAGIDTTGLRSKSWDEFTRADAPRVRAVITVCDNAASEPCPWWPGSPVTVHWGYPDPSIAEESTKAQAFETTRQAIGYRLLQLLALPLSTMDDDALRRALTEIGKQ